MSSSDRARFVDECVRCMNVYRVRHQATPLKHNPELTTIAQRWAEELVRKNCLSHNNATYKGQPLGENCANQWTSNGLDFTASQVVDGWYAEVKDYDFRTNSGGSKTTGHFTQVVWKGSREVGLGKAASRDGKTIMVVANFFPAGNYRGQYGENVSAPADGKIILPSSSSSGVPTGGGGSGGGGWSGGGSSSKLSPRSTTTSTTVKSEQARRSPVQISRFSDHQVRSSSPQWDDQLRPYSGGGGAGGGAGSRQQAMTTTTSSSGSSQVLQRQTRTETTGSGANAVTKTITMETVRGPDGKTKTVTTESITKGSAGGANDDFSTRFGQMGFGKKW